MKARNLFNNMVRRLKGIPISLKELDAALALLSDLRRWGWQASVRRGAPILNGIPVPWLTYPAIVALDRALRGDEAVFEFGAGNSTLWFASRAASVESVEGGSAWADRLRLQLPPQATLHAIPHEEPQRYLGCLSDAGRVFDVIVVDGGPDRNLACVLAEQYLAPDGLIVLDNAEVGHYADGVAKLGEQGFVRVDFHGPSPGARYMGCTSFFTREPRRWFPGSGMVSPRPVFEESIARLPGTAIRPPTTP